MIRNVILASGALVAAALFIPLLASAQLSVSALANGQQNLTIDQGDTYNITWDVQNAASCNESYSDNGPYAPGYYRGGNVNCTMHSGADNEGCVNGTYTGTGSYAIAPSGSEGPSGAIGTYTFSCTDPSGNSSSANVTINVAPPDVSITANGQSSLIVAAGGNYTIAYNSDNSKDCTLSWQSTDGTQSGSTPIPNSATVWANGGTSGSGGSGLIGTYTYSCDGWNGETVSKSVTITQQPSAPAEPAMSAPQCNASGTQVTLSWGTVAGANEYYPRVDDPAKICGGDVTYLNGNTPSCDPSNGYELIDGIAPGAPTYYDQASLPDTSITVGITPGVTYTWWVYAWNSTAQLASTDSSESFSCTPATVAPSCSVTVTPSSIQNGGSATVSWTSSNAQTFYINSIGYVGSSGSTNVSPSSSTNYSGSATSSSGTNVTCPATLTVSGGGGTVGGGTCPDGSAAPGGDPSQCSCAQGNTSACSSSGGTCPDGSAAPGGNTSECTCAQGNQNACGNGGGGGGSCPAGQYSQNGSCVGSCSLGYTLENGQCFFKGCPSGYTQEGSQCVAASCPTGYQEEDGACVFTSCPSGYSQTTGSNGNPECTNGACTAGPICSNGNAYIQTASCKLTDEQVCNYGCSNGACLLPPSASIVEWLVKPTLVKSGATTNVTWQSQNAQSCTVTGTNGDSWTALSGNETSSALTSQTTYTLLCEALPGATPSSVSSSTVVSIAPNFCETGAPNCP